MGSHTPGQNVQFISHHSSIIPGLPPSSAGVTAQIAVVSEKIHLCLETEQLQNVIAQIPIDIDLDLPDLDPGALKVTDNIPFSFTNKCDAS